jgi:hypothetical protein
MGVEERYMAGFGRKNWIKEPLGRRSSRWEDNIIMNPKGGGRDDMDWTHLPM